MSLKAEPQIDFGVTGCRNCPFSLWDKFGFMCALREEVKEDPFDEGKLPFNCPLKIASRNVKLMNF